MVQIVLKRILGTFGVPKMVFKALLGFISLEIVIEKIVNFFCMME